VLFATDRSAASRAALLAVAGLGVGSATEVVVLHVDDSSQPGEAEGLAGEIAGGLIALAVNARPEVRRARRGGVAAEIATAAAEYGSDLVVLGSRGRSDFGGLLLGSVSYEVMERVSCPVLVVRAGRRATGRRRRVLLAVAASPRRAGSRPRADLGARDRGGDRPDRARVRRRPRRDGLAAPARSGGPSARQRVARRGPCQRRASPVRRARSSRRATRAGTAMSARVGRRSGRKAVPSVWPVRPSARCRAPRVPADRPAPRASGPARTGTG